MFPILRSTVKTALLTVLKSSKNKCEVCSCLKVKKTLSQTTFICEHVVIKIGLNKIKASHVLWSRLTVPGQKNVHFCRESPAEMAFSCSFDDFRS